jgi:hypothetical protein
LAHEGGTILELIDSVPRKLSSTGLRPDWKAPKIKVASLKEQLPPSTGAGTKFGGKSVVFMQISRPDIDGLKTCMQLAL